MNFFKVLCALIGFTLLGGNFAMSSEIDLPQNMIWSCYDVGSSGYIQASAVANAFLKKYDIHVRLIPSGTSIGRVMPLMGKRASVGFLANEAFFGSEGSYDFAVKSWGPQSMRAIAGRPTSFPLITTQSSGIKKVSDLKGKRVSWVIGNPSLNVKMTAILAFAKLTWQDVQKIEFPGYAPSLTALIQGNVDAAVGSTTASVLYELERSKKGIYYPELIPEDKDGWARLRKHVPFAFPYKEGIGAGIDKEKPIWLLGYRYPVVTVRDDADPSFVYNFLKALDQAYPLYKDTVAGMVDWDLSRSAVPPIDIPFHEGAIKYLKEKNLWQPAHQDWNDKAVSRLERLKKEWEESLNSADVKKMDNNEFKNYWMKLLSEMAL